MAKSASKSARIPKRSASARILNRELSALALNERVLDLAADPEQPLLERVRYCFEREVFPVLTPLGVGPGQPFPFISPLSLSLGVLVRDPKTDEERFARLKVPEGLPRFLRVGAADPFLPLERVIAHFLPRLFPGMGIEERGVFRVTRDSDFEVSTRRFGAGCSRVDLASGFRWGWRAGPGSRCRIRLRRPRVVRDRMAARSAAGS
jgi:polyphosphate kinase